MYTNLLLDFSRAQFDKAEPTFLQIAGVASRELTWSRLLAFFLSPKNGHSLSKIFLESLLAAAGENRVNLATEEVACEYATDRGGFLDIVIACDDLMIGIENKVFSGVQNDLEDYAKSLSRVASERTCDLLLILLTLGPLDHPPGFGFVNVTWASFVRQIRMRIGSALLGPISRTAIYCQEFLSTVENTIGEKRMDEKFTKFVSANQDTVMTFLEQVDLFENGLATKAKELGSRVTEIRGPIAPNPMFWGREKLCAICYFEFATRQNAKLVVDVSVQAKGWRIEVFCRDNKLTPHLIQDLEQDGLSFRRTSGRPIWREYPFDEDLAIVARDVASLLETITRRGL